MRAFRWLLSVACLGWGQMVVGAEPAVALGDGNAGTVQSTLSTRVESAQLGPAGLLESEFVYRAAIAAYATPWGDQTLHTGTLQFAYPVDDRMEFRAGWDMFGVVPDERDTISGVGDPWLVGKFAYTHLPTIDYPHALAIVGYIRPGLGQVPVTVDGVTFAVLARYSIRFDPVRLDTLAGLTVNTADDPSYVGIPLGGRVVWPATRAVDLYGEVTETLQLTALRSSETQIGVGCAMRPAEEIELTVSGGLGLSESLPAGFVQFGIAFVLSNLES